MSKTKLFDVVALLEDLPAENLRRGQVGSVVEIFNDGEAFEVEFVDPHGSTYGLVTIKSPQFMVLTHEPSEKIAA